MERFVKKIILFCILAPVLFLLVKFYTIPHLPRNFYSAYIVKLKMLETERNYKKIVLIGGSSVGFGISAAQIQQETGIRTINLGQGAGLGLTDSRDFILKNLTKDDIIIFSPEWDFYQDPSLTDAGTLDNFIDNDPQYGKMIGKPLYIVKSLFSPIYSYEFNKAGTEEKENENILPYVYNCLNSNGDIVSHCGLKPKGPRPYKVNVKQFDIGKFMEAFPFVTKSTTLIVFPPTQQNIYKKYGADLNAVEKILKEHKLHVMGDIADNVYADSCFFDAEYHLTCQSRTVRTEKIITGIKKDIVTH